MKEYGKKQRKRQPKKPTYNTTFPSDFIIVIDTREQRPLFTRTKGLTTIVDTVPVGDYTIKGFESKFCIERKQISDLLSYIGKERDRTLTKLKSMSTYDFAALVVEASYDDLMIQNIHSFITPNHIRGFFASISVKYGIHVFTEYKRSWIEQWILDHALKFYDVQRGV